MFLRCCKRRKDGKEHLYWSVVENRRLADQRVQADLVEEIIEDAQAGRGVTGAGVPEVIGHRDRARSRGHLRVRGQPPERVITAQQAMTPPEAAMSGLLGRKKQAATPLDSIR